MTAALTIKRGTDATTRDEYDENDPAAVAEMARKFDAAVSGMSSPLAYKTANDGKSETIRTGEFPAVGEKAEVTVTPQYSGG